MAKYLILLVLFSNTLMAQSRLNVNHHINLGRTSFNSQFNKAGHVHALGGASSLLVSSMDIPSAMKKDFYLLGSISTLLGGAHYFSSIDSDEQRLEEELRGDKNLYKNKAVRDEHYLHSMAERAKMSRLYSSASLIASGSGYIAYYFKYKDQNVNDSHRASLASLVIGVGKLFAGAGQLFHESHLEKASKYLLKNSHKISWSVDYINNAPAVLVTSSF